MRMYYIAAAFMGLSACTSEDMLRATNPLTIQAEIPLPGASSCAFNEMTKNGASASDPTRTAYACWYGVTSDPETSLWFMFFDDSASPYHGGKSMVPPVVPWNPANMQWRGWHIDANCALHIMTTHIQGLASEYITLTDPVLNDDGTLKDVTAYLQYSGETRVLHDCQLTGGGGL